MDENIRGRVESRLGGLERADHSALAGALGSRCLDIRQGHSIVRIRARDGRLVLADDHRERPLATFVMGDPTDQGQDEPDVHCDADAEHLRADLLALWFRVFGADKPTPKKKMIAKVVEAPRRPQLVPPWAFASTPMSAHVEGGGGGEDGVGGGSGGGGGGGSGGGSGGGAADPLIAKPSPTVLVIGAGIAGLTAAQELVERGIAVRVVEREICSKEINACAVGGVARTPYVHLPFALTTSSEAKFTAARAPLLLQTPTFPGRFTMSEGSISPDDSAPEPVVAAFHELLKAVADEVSPADPLLSGARPWVVYCVGTFGPHDDPGKAQARAEQLAAWLVNVLDTPVAPVLLSPSARGMAAGTPATGPLRPSNEVLTLTAAGPGPLPPPATFRFVPEIRMSATAALGDNPDQTVVELHVGQYLVPSEHGYRVFPGFYRHMFDTMKRIPLTDAYGRSTRDTAFDNLVAVNEVQMYRYRNSDMKREAHTFPRRPARSLEELRQMFRDLRKFGFEDRDIALFEVRMLKYLTSCRDRREAEAEGKHWQEYIGIEDFERKGRENRFAEALRDAPLSLLAARADQVDARTHLNTAAQLFLDHVRMDRTSDLTLNGPTSEALFTPWKRYLASQGVKFYRGTLKRIDLPDDRLEAVWESPPLLERGSEALPSDHAYVVLAIDLSQLFKVLEASPDRNKFTGDLQKLNLWKQKTEREVADEVARQERHGETPDPSFDFRSIGAVGPQKDHKERWVPTGPFRTMAGLQYYFESGVRVGGKGHVYYIGAPWGVSSISQPSYWRTRMMRQNAGFISNLSVDLCNWYNDEFPKETADHLEDLPAFDAEGRKQVDVRKSALETPTLAADTWDQLLHPLPQWTRANLAKPHWVNVDWNLVRKIKGDPTSPIVENTAPYLINRPEDNASRPKFRRDPTDPDADRLERDKHGSERGRAYHMAHSTWVIAGNHMPTKTRLTSMEAANESARHAVNAILYRIVKDDGPLMGEFCDTWDPEQNELADLEPLKRLDERMMERKLPHAFDVLRLEKSIILSPTDAFDHINNLVDDAYKTLQDDGGAIVGLGDWEKFVKNIVEKGQKWFK